MIDIHRNKLRCPDCGAGIKWGESTNTPGARGRAECLRERQMFAVNDCKFRGHVIRQADGTVQLMRDEPVKTVAMHAIDRVIDWFLHKRY